MPLARKIGVLRLQGKSDRQIVGMLGISRTTMYRMLDKAKAVLQEEFGEI
jgi:transposase